MKPSVSRLPVGALSAVMVAVLSACPPPPKSNPAGTGKTIEASIGAAGGALELEGAKLTVPAGAVNADLKLSITSVQNPAASNYIALTPVFLFKPDGTDFAAPVTVEFDLGSKAATNPIVFWTRKGSSVFERQSSTRSGSKVSAQVTHFSQGFVAEAQTTGGADGGRPTDDAFRIIDLDPTARGLDYFAAAVDPSTGKVGVVYYAPRGTQSMPGMVDGGVDDFNLKYVEYANGVVSTPEVLTFVQRKVGLAIAFDPTTGDPVVAYLGGSTMFQPGMSAFWFQSDAMVRRKAGGVWQPEVAVTTMGDQVTCGNPVSDRGFLVGLWPALSFDAAGKLTFAYRDGHDGQFPQQDWSGSDVEVIEDVFGTRRLICAKAGGNDKGGWGGRIRVARDATDLPAMTYDKVVGTSDGRGNDVVFQRRLANGTWGPAAVIFNISDTMTGATIAHDPQVGWAVAVTDGQNNKLLYRRNDDPQVDSTKWQQPEEVFASGTGGWFPSLAIQRGSSGEASEPAIAYYVCSRRDQVEASRCTQDQDELRVIQKFGGNDGTWRDTVVDPGGGYQPQLSFIGRQRVVVYRVPAALKSDNSVEPTAGALKLALENIAP
jgi:hypothetical protein